MKEDTTACRAMADLIRRARREMSLSQTVFARRMGMSPQYLNELECGTTAPDLLTLLEIAEAIDKPLSEVLDSE